MFARCAIRLTARSAGPRWRLSAASATGSQMTRSASLPIRGQLTVAFAASMAGVVGGLSVFVYLRTGSDLLDTIDAGLRSRAGLLGPDIQHKGPPLGKVKPTPIAKGARFAQTAA